MLISIHAPRTGSDPNRTPLHPSSATFQSTLPARGATAGCGSQRRKRWHFNPRSPHGERLATLARKILQDVGFQSTLPARGATIRRLQIYQSQSFQSTLPARGATCMGDCVSRGDAFQSTLPARGATTVRRFFCATTRFQSTLPARGATAFAYSCEWRKSDFNPRSPHGERR